MKNLKVNSTDNLPADLPDLRGDGSGRDGVASVTMAAKSGGRGARTKVSRSLWLRTPANKVD